MNLAEIHVTDKAPFSGRALAESKLRERGLIIVGIRRADGELLLPPPSTAAIASGDYLIALGPSTVIKELIVES